MQNPKITILIPTRNGGKYVGSAIRSVLSCSYRQFELIVSNNHSTDETAKVLGGFQDERLKVVMPPSLLSMTKHYEWCLKQAQGEWVTIVGDDDGIMPFFFEKAQQLISRCQVEGVEAISFKRAYYFWPGFDRFDGDAYVHIRTGSAIRKVSCASLIEKALKGRLSHYDLPQVYTNNLVKKSLIDSIRSRSGGLFYHELNPDVYSGCVVAQRTKCLLRCDFPIFWTGTSPKSVGVAMAKVNQSEFAQSVDEKSAERSDEFFRLATSQRIGVAAEVGIDRWRKLKLSPLFVYSALRKSPFSSAEKVICRRLLENALKGCRISLFSETNPNARKEKRRLIEELASENSIASPFTSWRNLISHLVFFGLRAKRKLVALWFKFLVTVRLRPRDILVISNRNGTVDTLDQANSLLR